MCSILRLVCPALRFPSHKLCKSGRDQLARLVSGGFQYCCIAYVCMLVISGGLNPSDALECIQAFGFGYYHFAIVN